MTTKKVFLEVPTYSVERNSPLFPRNFNDDGKITETSSGRHYASGAEIVSFIKDKIVSTISNFASSNIELTTGSINYASSDRSHKLGSGLNYTGKDLIISLQQNLYGTYWQKSPIYKGFRVMSPKNSVASKEAGSKIASSMFKNSKPLSSGPTTNKKINSLINSNINFADYDLNLPGIYKGFINSFPSTTFTTPYVIIDIGYLSNYDLVSKLIQPSILENYALSISIGILDYFGINTSSLLNAEDEYFHSYAVSLINASSDNAIKLSYVNVLENQPSGTLVGRLGVTKGLNDFTFSLVNGDFDDNNNLFEISKNELKTKQVFDESVRNKYFIRVRATAKNRKNRNGLFISYERSFVITILPE